MSDREYYQDRHIQMAQLRERHMTYKEIGRELGVKDSTVIHHLGGRCACYSLKAWRNRGRVRERQTYIVKLADANPGITLMQIAIKVFEVFGNPETGKPLHYSSIIHHLRTAKVPGTLERRYGEGGASTTRSRDE